MRSIIVIAHNIRSSHNVGSLFRTCDGLGIDKIYLTGYTPYPKHVNDKRLPHLADKIDRQIHKTALGAQHNIVWEYSENVEKLIYILEFKKYLITALEQADSSISLPEFMPPNRIALILGNEVLGLDASILTLVSNIIEIPMFGQKESFNVVQAAAICLYHLRLAK